jgi:type VI secretion system protein ImpK
MPEVQRSLADLCSDFFVLILQLRENKEYGDADLLRQRIKDLLNNLEREARLAAIDSEDTKMALYALIAFVDETILGSEWSQKTAWLAQPLALELYNDFKAGEGFFERLEQLRQRAQTRARVLEVYYLCLTLGFKGKYLFIGPEQLRAMIEEIHRELQGPREKSATGISPNGLPREEVVARVREIVPAWVIGVAAFAIGFVFYVIMSLLISNEAESVTTTINGLLK